MFGLGQTGGDTLTTLRLGAVKSAIWEGGRKLSNSGCEVESGQLILQTKRRMELGM